MKRSRDHECWTFAIFGGTGDLAHRKLLPALAVLRRHNFLCADCVVLGLARDREMNDEAYRAQVREVISQSDIMPAAELDRWVERSIFYEPTGDGKREDFERLRARIERLESERGIPPNRAFYLAIPPQAFPATIEGLGEVGLNQSRGGWTRIVIEKPSA